MALPAEDVSSDLLSGVEAVKILLNTSSFIVSVSVVDAGVDTDDNV